MKKGILFALAALCVSAVQAVTINWTDNKGFGDFTATGAVELAVKFVAVNTTPLSAGGDKFTLGGIILNGDGGQLGISNSVWTQGDFSDDRLAGKINGEYTYNENTLTLYFNVDENGTWTATKYKIEFANTQVEGPKVFHNNQTLTLTTDAISAWTTSANGTMNITGATLKGDNIAVPEPTALALLALGVAGLALRRKVA